MRPAVRGFPGKIQVTIVIFILFVLISEDLSAEDSELKLLLAGFLKNDAELKELMLDLRKAELELGKTKISTGITISLTSGTMELGFDGETAFKAEPGLTLKVPALNDAALSVSFPVEIDGGSRQTSSEIDLSVGLISDARDQRNISLLKSNRALTEAKRAVGRRSREAEGKFYENLKKLYEYRLEVFSLTDDLITEELEFEAVKAQDYSRGSPSYRSAELEVRNAKREVAEAERILQDNLGIFARNCGAELNTLPEDLPEITPDALPDAHALNPGSVQTIESAEWTHFINKRGRDAGRSFTLSLSTGFVNKIDFNTFLEKETESRVSGALVFKRDGLSLSLGSYIPINQDKKPGLTFSFGITPQDFALKKLNDEEKNLEEQRELLNIASARKDWDELVSELDTTRLNLGWFYSERKEQFELYSELEAEMRGWMERGIVSGTAWREAALKKEKARADFLLNLIDMLIYKTELSLYSVDDDGPESAGSTEAGGGND